MTDGHGAPLKAIEADSRPVVFFDIDNCLYSKHSGIPGMMKEKIRQYILSLGLDEDEARDLHMRYYKSAPSPLALLASTDACIAAGSMVWLSVGLSSTTASILSSTTASATKHCLSRCASCITSSSLLPQTEKKSIVTFYRTC